MEDADIYRCFLRHADTRSVSDECMNDGYNVDGEDCSLKEMAEIIAREYSIGIEYALRSERI